MEYSEMSLTELRSLAKERGVKGYSAMKKQELIDLFSTETADKKEPARKSSDVRKKVSDTKVADTKVADTKVTNTKVVDTKVVDGIVAEGYESPNTEPFKRPQPQRISVGMSGRNAENRPQGGENRPMGSESRQQNGRSFGASGSGSYDGRSQGQQESRGQGGDYRAQNQRNGYVQNQDGRQLNGRATGPNAANSYGVQGQQRMQRPQGQNVTGQNIQSNEQQGSRQASAASSGRIVQSSKITTAEREALDPTLSPEIESLDSGETKTGILELIPDGYGFIRCNNFLPGDDDVYVSPAQIRKFNLKTGDIVVGNTKIRSATEKFSALLYIKSVNGFHPNDAAKRPRFEDLTPIFPNYRLRLETPGCTPAMRIVDLLSPIGKGQRGMIVSQPKAGKTTLLKQIANALTKNYPDLHIIILLIDERPEEVTDMKESIQGPNVEVIYSTFDELPDNHRRVSEMVIERAKRLVEHKKDVVILLDSITRLARAYNLTVQASGRTLSGGLDPAALHMPKKFFGAARCMREGGSLTVLATALVETGSRMDDVVFEEFKGTGNMELVLDRNLSERRIFPAIDLPKSSTRREDLLLSPAEVEANNIIRRAFNSARPEDAVERIINMFAHTRSNAEFIEVVKKTKL